MFHSSHSTYLLHIITRVRDYGRRLKLVIGFIEILQIVAANNYIANLYTLRSLQHIISLSQFVFISRFLGTDPNNFLFLHLYRLANISKLTKL
jgi:hypothetical protein